LEDHPQVVSPLLGLLLAGIHEQLVGRGPEVIGKVPHLNLQEARHLRIDLPLEDALRHGQLKIGLLDPPGEAEPFEHFALRALHENGQAADQDGDAEAGLLVL
jgi:hypothetical protein